MNSSIWKEKIEIHINDHVLNKSEWQISIGQLSGHFLYNVTATDVILKQDDKVEVFLPFIDIDLGIWSTLIGDPKLESIKIQDYEIIVNEVKNVNPKVEQKNKFDFPIQIEQINLSGSISLPIGDSIHIAHTNFIGSIEKNDRELKLKISDLNIVDADSLVSLQINKTNIFIDSTSVRTVSLHGNFTNVPFKGELIYTYADEKQLSGDFNFTEYVLPEYLYAKIPLKPKFSNISGDVSIETDFESFKGNIDIENELGLDMEGDFLLYIYNDHLLLDHLSLKDEFEELMITGLMEYSGRISSRTQLSSFDISQWLVNQRKTNLNGVLLFDGFTEKGQLSDITLTMEVSESKLYSKDAISLSGSIAYFDSALTFIDPLFIAIGPSSINVDGKVDLQEDFLDLQLDLNNADVFLINNFWADTLEQGTATGALNVSGAINQPNIRGNVQCEDIVYKDFYLSSASLNLSVDNGFDVKDGYAILQFNEGVWKRGDDLYQLDNGTVDAVFYPDKIELENLHIFSGDNFVQLSGKLTKENQVIIDRIQLMYDKHYLINPKPILIDYNKDKISVKPFVLHVDDGIAEGYFTKEKEIDALIKLSNIDANIVSYVTKDDRMKLNGTAFGECSLKKTKNSMDISVDLTVKEGEFANQPFDDMVLSFFIHDGILSIEEISLTNRGLTGARLSGMIPLEQSKVSIPFNLESSFHNLNIKVLTQFIPDWFTLGGQISGEYNLHGNETQTKFYFDVDIDDAVFDRIPLGFVEGEGNYDGTFLNFTSFSSDFGEKHLSGSASLPVDYNIGSERFGRANLKNPVQVDVRGEGDNLWFMSPYISIIDSLDADFDIVLQIYGTWKNLIRDGSVIIKNGTLYSNLIEDPIRKIYGEGTWENNQLTISEFEGLMSSNKKDKNNLEVSGQIDMSRFFRPKYDLNVEGNNLYFSAISEDLSGNVDADLTITGRDTITIEGNLPIINVEMYKEFIESSVGGTSKSDNAIVMDYQVKFPLDGDFTLLNNQIDATFGGEISISQTGNAPADFLGEAFTKEGKFYYSSNIFNITQGFLSFGGKGFNPYLDISAYTNIDDERIEISFIGPLDNPKLILVSESGFSQSDILELLTWGKRFEDQEFSSTGFGTQAVAKIESWIEQQLNRKLLQISGLDNLEILDDISIAGAGNLINPSNGEEFTIKAGLSDNVSLNYAYKRSFSLTNPSHAVGMEYKVNRYFSIIGNIDEHGNVHAKYRLRYAY